MTYNYQMNIIFATTNVNKVKRIKNLLPNTPLLSLSDFNTVKDPPEVLSSALSIAAEKSLYYLDQLKIDTDHCALSQDDTIYFKNVDEEDQPYTSIKAPVIKKYGDFTDDNAVKYYADLANKYGGSIDFEFRYGHSIAKKSLNDAGRECLNLVSASSVLKGRLIPEAKNLDSYPGYFLAAMILVEVDGKEKYYSELTEEELVAVDKDLQQSIKWILNKTDVRDT